MSPASRTNTPGAGERPPGQHDASPHGPRRSRTVVLAAGCFWCLDSLARRLAGVTAVRSVYTGGTGPAEYIAVCNGTTGHAEAVEITYEPDTLPTEVLLDVFFSCHDPTSLNRQGYDVGTQYRSAMFYADRTEREEFAEAVARVQAAYDRPIVTTLEPLGRVFEAEPEHQGFHLRRPDVGYCRVIIDPKVSALRQRYAPWLRDGALV
ncbi:peptide-methionine (S)-S-oxide reductase MsrA [Nesterenkonia sp. PF2B19]|uniref:peptide-methionine (S)-S-oxide reductase MsrA n=1 Tax=Nesterenkonia sp. PF2B19 TaxID=1881858 RepID=UPI0009F4048C|nr:peptide-methionine (S)-S-oxide reductase MsrA [Nesterenkonia sp. PF2B19]OSM44829.1 peptide-methionine (S)-S-oxide reductase [Nesterenkonia sp. PF2B19]